MGQEATHSLGLFTTSPDTYPRNRSLKISKFCMVLKTLRIFKHMTSKRLSLRQFPLRVNYHNTRDFECVSLHLCLKKKVTFAWSLVFWEEQKKKQVSKGKEGAVLENSRFTNSPAEADSLLLSHFVSSPFLTQLLT